MFPCSVDSKGIRKDNLSVISWKKGLSTTTTKKTRAQKMTASELYHVSFYISITENSIKITYIRKSIKTKQECFSTWTEHVKISPKVLTPECHILLLAFNILVQVMYQKTVIDGETHTHTHMHAHARAHAHKCLQTPAIIWGLRSFIP